MPKQQGIKFTSENSNEELNFQEYVDNKSMVSDIVSNLSGTNTNDMPLNYTPVDMLNFYSDIFNANNHCVVQLIAYTNDSLIESSGFFINYPDDYIVTSLCAIQNKKGEYENGTRIIVHISPENKTREARCYAIDHYNSIVILKLNSEWTKHSCCIKWGRGNNVTIGEHVFTINKTPSIEYKPFCDGIVTHNHYQHNSDTPEQILTNFDVNKCSNGQPVFNINSQLIGMITTINKNKVLINSSILLNSIKIMYAQECLNVKDVINVKYLSIGIKYDQVTFNDIIDTGYEVINGVKITAIHKKSYLRKQLKVNDIITHMNDVKIGNDVSYHCLTTLLSLLDTGMINNKNTDYVLLTVRVHDQYPIYKTSETIKVKLINDQKINASGFI